MNRLIRAYKQAVKTGLELGEKWLQLEPDDLKTTMEQSGFQTRGSAKVMVNKAVKATSAAFINAHENLTKEELLEYDLIIVAFSGGKDSQACFLHLLDLGVPTEKIELWHHDIDGREGSNLMDWECTREYCRKFAAAFNVPIYFSWKKGGFEGEMLRNNSRTQATCFETPEGIVKQVGGDKGNESTRLKFPQVSADLSVRWCSSYLKISVCSVAINNQKRLENKKTLLITGERAQESTSRSHYFKIEEHSSNGKKRTVHQYRPVHSWDEKMVWDILEKYRVNSHPAYQLGWGRVSCKSCIFGNKNQWSSVRKISPETFQKIADYETQFETTIQRSKSVVELADEGVAYDMPSDLVKQAVSEVYSQPIIVPDDEKWTLPVGAFGDSCGPT